VINLFFHAILPLTEITDDKIYFPPAILPLTEITDDKIYIPPAILPLTEITDDQIYFTPANRGYRAPCNRKHIALENGIE
jgi:hypothetical protein